MKLIIRSFILFFCTNTCFAQKILSPSDVTKKIDSFMSQGYNTPDVRNLKDSVDLYSFAIELKVVQKDNKTLVNSIKVNDSIAYVLYKNFDFLKGINFTSVMRGQRQATIIIPVAIIIAYVKRPVSPVPLLKAESVGKKIIKMFNYDYKNNPDADVSTFIYLQPTVITTGTKIYD